MRLFKDGNQLSTAAHIGRLQKDDVVVVSWDGPPDEVPNTTHRANFVQHEIPPSPIPTRTARRCSAPFDGRTSYNLDYVAHAGQPQNPIMCRKTWQPPASPTGASTYTTEFVKMHLPPRMSEPLPKKAERPPLDARTTHREEYVHHNVEPTRSMRPQRRELPLRSFDGATTYKEEYSKVRPMSAPRTIPPPSPRPSRPFDGESEYTREFAPKEMEHKCLIYMEPVTGTYK